MQKVLEIEFNLEVLLDIVMVSVEELYQLESGSILDLNKKIEEVADIYINKQKRGEGEITIKNSKYAIKIKDLNN